ncbi:hypothetical protein PanWU01x14_223540 [Parasponia andersonii]|uniref:Uncharacterized protein n=1 Tax=Parasponia andersonii TaxID=3476 RepID=A0A2P5BNL8_PARAD|nr:hypothetical protein PanWU01x14_223540 [Parasponia andersonii]
MVSWLILVRRVLVPRTTGHYELYMLEHPGLGKPWDGYSSMMESIKFKVCYVNGFVVNNIGKRGGLLLLSSDEWDVRICFFSKGILMLWLLKQMALSEDS